MYAKRFILIHSLLSVVTCKTIYLELNTPSPEEISFLKRYGYLNVETEDQFEMAYTPQSLSEALRKMQEFAGLPQTGVLDTETKLLFNKRRCGVKDIDNSPQSIRSRRYIVQEGWKRRTITYRVLNGSSTLDKTRVESQMAEAFAIWAKYGNLHLKKVDAGRADIKVSFAAGDHGDGFPFDGLGHVVAHAFPPPHGAMHFDDDELWTDDVNTEDENTTDLFAVAVHEIGHALGLSHSDVKASVMYPYYQVPVEKLHADDILGIQELYSKDSVSDGSSEDTDDSVTRSSLVPRFTKADNDEFDENYKPDLCMTNYDTIQVIHGKIYVFEEEWVWVLKDRNVMEAGYPKRFHEIFSGLPASNTIIKTIYEKQNRNVVIFAGRKYWEFGPSFRLIKRGSIQEYSIPADVTELTTVFISNYNNKTYLIEDERFWRYDEATEKMDEGYPKDMSAWRQVPYPVDAAMVWKGDTYFFRGARFWRFDDTTIQSHPYYPLPTAQIWFNCDPTTDMDRYTVNDRP